MNDKEKIFLINKAVNSLNGAEGMTPILRKIFFMQKLSRDEEWLMGRQAATIVNKIRKILDSDIGK